MDLFTIVEDAHVILTSRGVLRQAKVYRRGQRLYAQYGAGFIGLIGVMGAPCGSTTVPHVRWADIDVDFEIGSFGRLEVKS